MNIKCSLAVSLQGNKALTEKGDVKKPKEKRKRSTLHVFYGVDLQRKDYEVNGGEPRKEMSREVDDKKGHHRTMQEGQVQLKPTVIYIAE